MTIKIPEEDNMARSNHLPNMKILGVSYGTFESISHLHRNFQNGVKRLRITLEVNRNGNGNFSNVFNQLLALLPTLAQHKCCENWIGPQPAPKLTSGISIKKVGDNTDFAHLAEHVMIDLMCNIGGMQICSGITCGYESPRNRFDLFVECPRKRIGLFSANLAVHLIDYLLSQGKLPENSRETLDLAKLLQNPGRKKLNIQKLSQNNGWDKKTLKSVWKKLTDLHFFN